MLNDDNFASNWLVIKSHLDDMSKVNGGFSFTKKGIIRLDDNQSVFVKIGQDDMTKSWVAKEIELYKILEKYGYDFVPKLLAYDKDKTGLAVSGLNISDGWDWSDAWTSDRLGATLAAMDALAQISLNQAEIGILMDDKMDINFSGWRALYQSQEYRKITDKMPIEVDFEAEASIDSSFRLQETDLVHLDVRSDNCAWQQSSGKVGLVDWSWAQLGDRRIDIASLLVHVNMTGFDLKGTKFIDRLDKAALHWLAGYWLNASMSPVSRSKMLTLRQLQFEAGISALRLSREL